MPSASQGFAPPLITPNPFPANAQQQGGPYVTAGAPIAGTSCVQTVTIGGTPTAGTFTLTFGGQTTGSIAWTATDATLGANIAAALNALTDIGPSGVTYSAGTGSSGIGTYLFTFAGQNAALTVPAITVGSNSMTGTAPTVAVAVTTAGVTATLRGSLPGTEVVDYSVPKTWVNVGTKSAPQWVRTGHRTAVVPLTATTATTGGAVGSWQPPEGVTVLITRVYIYVATASTGAANVSVGNVATATTSGTQIIPATSVHTTGSVVDSITAQIVAATAAESGIVVLVFILTGGNFVTFTGSASTAGMVATAYIEYLVP